MSAGVTGADAGDNPVVLSPLVAVVLNVYATPFVSPLTTHEPDDPVTVQVFVASPTAVTVNDCGVGPAAAATVTVALELPDTAVGAGGVLGI